MMDKTNFMEILSASFAAGEVRTFMVSGGYFEVIDAAAPVDVRLTDQYGAVRGAMRNAEASFYLRAAEFSVIEITSATAQTVRFAFGTAEAGTRRAAGVVSVVDAAVGRSNAGSAFTGGLEQAASASVNSHAILRNPTGSGKNLLLTRVRARTGNGILLLRYQTTAFGTVSFSPPSVKLGAPASVAELRFFSGAAPGAFTIFQDQGVAGDSMDWTPSSPLVMAPGDVIDVTPFAINTSVRANFEFFEVNA